MDIMNVTSVTNGHAEYADGRTSDRIESLSVANEVAKRLTSLTGKKHLGVDRGSHTWPRFTVIEFPFAVGMEVSMGFNGDSYPQGKVAKISDSMLLVTLENGKRFYRRHLTESWKEAGGSFSLMPGVHDERNPSF